MENRAASPPLNIIICSDWQRNRCAVAVLGGSTTGVQRLCSVVGLSGCALGSSWIRRQDHIHLLRLLPRSCQQLQRPLSND
ncbi:hypothetical protein EV2_037886 [Malus domestica]